MVKLILGLIDMIPFRIAVVLLVAFSIEAIMCEQLSTASIQQASKRSSIA